MNQLPNACDQKVSVLPTDDYVAISRHTPLDQAIEAMKQDEGGCVIITDDGRVAGIFTERDLLTKVSGEDVDLQSPIEKWMQRDVQTLPPEATIGDAVRLINERSPRTTSRNDRQAPGRTRHGHDPFCRRLRRRYAADWHAVHQHIGDYGQRHFDAARLSGRDSRTGRQFAGRQRFSIELLESR